MLDSARRVLDGARSMRGVTWPLSCSRAAFARQQVPVGYRRNSILLGKQGPRDVAATLLGRVNVLKGRGAT